MKQLLNNIQGGGLAFRPATFQRPLSECAMTRIGKLQEKMLRGGQLSFAEFERLLAAYGFMLDRVRGSHHIYKHPAITDRINAQPDGKSAKPYQVRQFIVMVEANGLSVEDKA